MKSYPNCVVKAISKMHLRDYVILGELVDIVVENCKYLIVKRDKM